MLALLALVLSPSMVPQQTVDEGPSHLGAYLTTIAGLPRPVAAAFGPFQGRPNALFIATRGDAERPPSVQVFEPSADPEPPAPNLAELGADQLERPVGLAVSEEGDVFITDELQRMLWLLPAGGGEAVPAADAMALTLPAGVDVTGSGEAQLVVVADPGAGSAKLFRGGSLTPDVIGAELLVRPQAACFLDGPDGAAVRIAVCDRATHRIHVFDLDGGHERELLAAGPPPVAPVWPEQTWSSRTASSSSRTARTTACRPSTLERRDRRAGLPVRSPRDPPGRGCRRAPLPRGPRGLGRRPAARRSPSPWTTGSSSSGRAPGAEPVEDPQPGGDRPARGPLRTAACPGSGIYVATVSPESHQVQVHDLRGKEPAKISDVASYGTRFGMYRTPCATWLFHWRARSLLDGGRGERAAHPLPAPAGAAPGAR